MRSFASTTTRFLPAPTGSTSKGGGEVPYTTVVAGTTITAAWGNSNVRDQVVTPFATAAARTSAISAPIDGMFGYRVDGKVFEGWDGAAYVAAARYCPAVCKAVDESLSSSTALQNDDELLLSLAANATYILSARITYNSSTAADFKYHFTGPASFSARWSQLVITGGGSTWQLFEQDETTTPSIDGSGADRSALLFGRVTTVGAGTLTLQWAQVASDASATTVKAGSSMMLTRIS